MRSWTPRSVPQKSVVDKGWPHENSWLCQWNGIFLALRILPLGCIKRDMIVEISRSLQRSGSSDLGHLSLYTQTGHLKSAQALTCDSDHPYLFNALIRTLGSGCPRFWWIFSTWLWTCVSNDLNSGPWSWKEVVFWSVLSSSLWGFWVGSVMEVELEVVFGITAGTWFGICESSVLIRSHILLDEELDSELFWRFNVANAVTMILACVPSRCCWRCDKVSQCSQASSQNGDKSLRNFPNALRYGARPFSLMGHSRLRFTPRQTSITTSCLSGNSCCVKSNNGPSWMVTFPTRGADCSANWMAWFNKASWFVTGFPVASSTVTFPVRRRRFASGASGCSWSAARMSWCTCERDIPREVSRTWILHIMAFPSLFPNMAVYSSENWETDVRLERFGWQEPATESWAWLPTHWYCSSMRHMIWDVVSTWVRFLSNLWLSGCLSSPATHMSQRARMVFSSILCISLWCTNSDPCGCSKWKCVWESRSTWNRNRASHSSKWTFSDWRSAAICASSWSDLHALSLFQLLHGPHFGDVHMWRGLMFHSTSYRRHLPWNVARSPWDKPNRTAISPRRPHWCVSWLSCEQYTSKTSIRLLPKYSFICWGCMLGFRLWKYWCISS